MSMTRITWVLAIVLVVLGVGLWLGTGRESATALIPAFLGVLLGVAAALAAREPLRKHAMHAAVLLAVIGFAGAVPGVLAVVRSFGGAALEQPAAAWGRSAMAALCLVYVGLGVRSFLAARRAGPSAS
jgi:hypothetical protein